MLGDDYFRHDPARHALIGSRTGQMHRLGDVVTVRLVEAAPLAGALRFELLSESAPRHTKSKPPKGQRSARRAKLGVADTLPSRAKASKR